MSLRSRVLLAIALVLSVNAVFGAGLAGLRAHDALRAELQAALLGAGRGAEHALQEEPPTDRASQMRRLIATYEGDRHLRAEFLGSGGRLIMASDPFIPAHPAPRWFANLIDARLNPVRVAVPASAGNGVLIFRPSPAADIADSWLNFSDLMMILGLACLLGCGLVFLLIGQALRPLNELVSSFGLIGSGNYQIRVAERGSSEIASIGRAFNLMAGQLTGMRDRNRSLEEQLLKLQDEERADLARDLHDDIGPYLFAVSVDAAMVDQLLAAGNTQEVPAQVKAIQSSVAHMQSRVRDILGRLRPTRLIELGLEPAIRDLVAFWHARRPEITFETAIKVDEERLTDDVKEAAYRVVQESLSNAVRHGRPSLIAIDLTSTREGEVAVRVTDDGGSNLAHPRKEPGFGLLGMKERVVQAGGSLEIEAGLGAGGWTVSARLPMTRRRRGRGRKAA